MVKPWVEGLVSRDTHANPKLNVGIGTPATSSPIAEIARGWSYAACGTRPFKRPLTHMMDMVHELEDRTMELTGGLNYHDQGFAGLPSEQLPTTVTLLREHLHV